MFFSREDKKELLFRIGSLESDVRNIKRQNEALIAELSSCGLDSDKLKKEVISKINASSPVYQRSSLLHLTEKSKVISSAKIKDINVRDAEQGLRFYPIHPGTVGLYLNGESIQTTTKPTKPKNKSYILSEDETVITAIAGEEFLTLSVLTTEGIKAYRVPVSSEYKSTP